MRDKLQNRAFENVAAALMPGEQPGTATRAMVGKFSSGRYSTLIKQGLVLDGIGSVGAAIASANAKQFVVVTDRRLIFLPQTILGGPGTKVLGSVPRELVSVAEVKMALVSLVRLAFGDQGDGVALTFPRQDRRNAEALAAALSGVQVLQHD